MAFRPSFLTSYINLSVISIMTFRWGGIMWQVKTPTLKVIGQFLSFISRNNAFCSLLKTAWASACEVTGNNKANSSPPSRARTSVFRICFCSVCVTKRNASSPTPWPYWSLTALKWSKSIYSQRNKDKVRFTIYGLLPRLPTTDTQQTWIRRKLSRIGERL